MGKIREKMGGEIECRAGSAGESYQKWGEKSGFGENLDFLWQKKPFFGMKIAVWEGKKITFLKEFHVKNKIEERKKCGKENPKLWGSFPKIWETKFQNLGFLLYKN